MAQARERAAQVLASLQLLRPASFTDQPAEQALLWKIRKGLYPSIGGMRTAGASVLIEDVNTYFEMDTASPYMLLVAPVQKARCKPRQSEIPEDGDLLPVVNQVRSDIPSVTHWDYSARIQTVHKETNPLYHEVISRFKELSGYGVIVNTSFNVRGEPIVCTPQEAYTCFMRTEMDYLYLQGFWLEKKIQPQVEDKEDWRSEFTLD